MGTGIPGTAIGRKRSDVARSKARSELLEIWGRAALGVSIYFNKYVFFNDKSENPLKNTKTSCDPYLDQDLTLHVNKSHIHLVI
jgi:hypothetical protein